MRVYTLTAEELTEEINKGKDILASGLHNAGVINDEQYTQITEDFAVMLAAGGMFGSKIRKSLGWKEDNNYYKIIQLNNFNNNNNKEVEDVHQSEDSDTEGVDNGDS